MASTKKCEDFVLVSGVSLVAPPIAVGPVQQINRIAADGVLSVATKDQESGRTRWSFTVLLAGGVPITADYTANQAWLEVHRRNLLNWSQARLRGADVYEVADASDSLSD